MHTQWLYVQRCNVYMSNWVYSGAGGLRLVRSGLNTSSLAQAGPKRRATRCEHASKGAAMFEQSS